ncbi:hypothetical protein JTE90_017363 [Oedothorax gibbosus]|uniref:polynucleotide adenylyltransferase n=1 Tax=Oedothorax gibbosus TaxID=931172 RepID=A0AAV6VRI5_9ARAC|nr:hypothetical protein JTE90_017363 [Oedothorax gibbosus]
MDTPNYTPDSFIPFMGRTILSQSIPRNFERRHPHTRHIACKDPVRVPWKISEAYSCGVIGLHEEITDFYEVMKPTEEEAEVRLKVVEHVTRIVHSLWPQAKVEVFGSFRTGLYLPSSDIDMVIIGEWRSVPLSTLSQALERNGVQNCDINIIASATVPIIRLLHSHSKVRVDISFNMTNGVKSAKMIKKLIKEHPALPKLVMVLKQFLVHRGLNEVYNGGMSSYCLTLLILSYLQGCHKPRCSPSLNLGTMLIEFFEHYGVNFNYEKVSIHFQNGGNYRPRGSQGGTLLCVEDPLVQGHDVAKGTYLMHLLKISFQNAYYALSKSVSESSLSGTPYNSFLSLVLKVDEEVLHNRQQMQHNAPKIIRKLNILLNNPPSESSSQSSPVPKQRKSNQFHKKKRFSN